MKVLDWEKKLTIETKFPQEMYDKYLFQTGVEDGNKMSLSQMDKIFLLSRDDFITGKLGLDEFSDICNNLFGYIVEKIDSGKDMQIMDVLLAGAELSFYVRQNPNPEKDKQLLYFLQEVSEYKKSS